MANLSSFIKALSIGLVIPAIGFAVSFFILSDINGGYSAEGLPNAIPLCQAVTSGEYGEDAIREMSDACQEINRISLLGKGSITAGIIGVFIPLIYWLTSVFAGENRRRIALLFPVVLRLSTLLIAASVLLQGAILTYAVYIGESYAIGRIHMFLIAAVGLGAVVGGLKLIGASLSFGKKLNMTVWGKPLNHDDAPQLFAYVRGLAENLGAKPPTNIVVGLEPTFYVTSADITVPGHDTPLKGETLFISAPLSRLMSKEEFASVVGHELGHFRGDDTTYSMRFAPIYAGLGMAINSLSSADDEGASGLAKIPAVVLLSYMYDVFATNQAKISRDREHKADIAGAEAGTAQSLSTALIKVSLYSGLWEHSREQNIARLNQGKVTSNLSAVFQDSAKYDVEHEKISDIMEATLAKSISHPTDTHPPVSKRLAELQVNPSEISKEMLLVPENPAINLLDNYEAVEEEITVTEHRYMVALGVAELPEEEDKNSLLRATYALAAAMVVADGKVDPDEIATAEGIGRNLFGDFDPVEFRDHCKNPMQSSDIEGLCQAVGEALSDEHKNLIFNYLEEISSADGEVSNEEAQLLSIISQGLGV